ncbi:hypothetical protein [Rhodococcus qingshengii]|uniref:Uncharacterized protein n=1 Tax=Rhodococcus qingshengii TaxID=334542 RepID=A0A2A5J347_RHOSG|nr:hypothetical protein [Rhodococcus qingshengii]PCK23639.1 hypothetical protein CHR55_29780 [Rhodococcus qingshengii]
MAASVARYSDDSRRLFMSTVAKKVENEVSENACPGPWLLSLNIKDAVQVAPGPNNTERHLCGLIDPNDARAVVAADPDNLRSLAGAMREAADNADTPGLIVDSLFDVAQRWDTAMVLRCSGVLLELRDPPVGTQSAAPRSDLLQPPAPPKNAVPQQNSTPSAVPDVAPAPTAPPKLAPAEAMTPTAPPAVSSEETVIAEDPWG